MNQMRTAFVVLLMLFAGVLSGTSQKSEQGEVLLQKAIHKETVEGKLEEAIQGAARERLYCSYLRADDNGRALAPSWYVDELKQALAGQGRACEVVIIPRSLIEKSTIAPFDRQELLLPDELAVRLTLVNQDPTSLIDATGNLPEIYSARTQDRRRARSLRQSLAGLRRIGRRTRRILETFCRARLVAHGALKPTRAVPFNSSPAMSWACNPSNIPKKALVPVPPSSASWATRSSTAFTRR